MNKNKKKKSKKKSLDACSGAEREEIPKLFPPFSDQKWVEKGKLSGRKGRDGKKMKIRKERFWIFFSAE